MDSSKVLYLLEILSKETEGYSRELTSIYKRALDEDDDIRNLKMLLNEFVFYHEIGKSIYNEGKELLDRIYVSPSESMELLPKIRQSNDKIERMNRACYELIYSPFPTNESINVLRKKDIISCIEGFKMIASVSVYLMLVYGGVDTVKNLIWDEKAGLQETYYSLNTRFIPALCSLKKPDYGWIIKKKKLGRKAIFCEETFTLKYESRESIEAQCKDLYKEPIGTHAYLNIDAFESGRCEVPYCWGTGNIISATPDNALSFLQSDVVTSLRLPNIGEYSRQVPTPIECIKQLADRDKYCITADELYHVMNNWLVGYSIESRKRNHACLFCGKFIDVGKYVCPSHFISEFK